MSNNSMICIKICILIDIGITQLAEGNDDNTN